jgi:hypothetical protein
MHHGGQNPSSNDLKTFMVWIATKKFIYLLGTQHVAIRTKLSFQDHFFFELSLIFFVLSTSIGGGGGGGGEPYWF